MKYTFILLLVLSAWLFVTSVLGYAESTAIATSIVSDAGDLRTEANMLNVMDFEGRTITRLQAMRKPFVALSYVSFGMCLAAIIGLVINFKKGIGENRPAVVGSISVPQSNPAPAHAGSKVEQVKPKEASGGVTELMLAVSSESNADVKQALSMGKNDVFLTDGAGRTALFHAAERGDEEIIWTLLFSLVSHQRGALLGVKDDEGNMAEDWAAKNGHEEIRRVLAVERQRIEFCE